MTETFCTSGSVKLKAGYNVQQATTITASNYTEWINQAESYINNAIKIDGLNLVSSYSSLNADVKKILEDACSSLSAIKAINFNTALYTQRQAETMLDVNYGIFADCMELLKDKNTIKYLQGIA